MGRKKEIYMQIMQGNDGIPEDMTVGDMLRMRDLNTYHWKEYERAQERARLQLDQQKNLGETSEDSKRESTGGEQNN